MNPVIKWTILLLLFIAGIVAIVQYDSKKLAWSNRKLEDSKDTLLLAREDNEFMKKLLFRTVKFGKPIPLDHSLILTDSSGKLFPLSGLFQGHNDNMLFFRFSQRNCASCIDSEIKKIKNLVAQTGKEKIVLLYSANTVKELKIIYNLYRMEASIFLLKEEDFAAYKIEDYNLPYYFIVNKSMLARQFFIPEKTLPGLTDAYLTEIAGDLSGKPFSPTGKEYAVLALNNHVIDLKKTRYMTESKVDVEYSNSGKTPLIISKIDADCGCTKIAWDRKPLASNSTGKFTITYSNTGIGNFAKKIHIYFNSADEAPATIEIKGETIK